ncbi:MAG: hypothetical protein WC966_07830 [Bradymonadales bacterium]|jgi:hypothetical protein
MRQIVFQNFIRKLGLFILLTGFFCSGLSWAQDPSKGNDNNAVQSLYQKKLRPIPAPNAQKLKDATLYVFANYRVYSVSINGQSYHNYDGNVGVKLRPYVANEVQIRAEIAGGVIDKKYTLSLKPDETHYLFVELGSAPPPKQAEVAPSQDVANDSGGFLSITSEVEGQVYVDGKLAAAKSPLQKHPVSVGSHSVRIYFLDTRKFSRSRDVYVAKGATMSLHFAKE